VAAADAETRQRAGRAIFRFRFGDFFSRMWLE